jgi:putative membrane protein
MFRTLLLAASAAAALSAAACNRGETTDPETEAAGAAATGQPAGTVTVAEAEAPSATTAAGFVTRAALSDMYEIESSRLALERSQSPGIKAYAQRMIDDHTRMSNEMKATVAQAGLESRPPAVLDEERLTLIRELRESSPGDFDAKYLDQQAESHENARNLFRDFSNNGDNDQLKQLASRGLPMIENHLQTVQALDKSDADEGATATNSSPNRPATNP